MLTVENMSKHEKYPPTHTQQLPGSSWTFQTIPPPFSRLDMTLVSWRTSRCVTSPQLPDLSATDDTELKIGTWVTFGKQQVSHLTVAGAATNSCSCTAVNLRAACGVLSERGRFVRHTHVIDLSWSVHVSRKHVTQLIYKNKRRHREMRLLCSSTWRSSYLGTCLLVFLLSLSVCSLSGVNLCDFINILMLLSWTVTCS